MTERKPFEQRSASLKQEGSTWVQTWKELRNYINPSRGFFQGDQPNRGKSIDHRTMLDGTPHRSAINLANGLASHLTSPSRPWWRPTLDDLDLMEYEPVKVWLANVERDMYAVQAGSNIYGALHSDYEEIGTFATSALAVLEDREDMIRGRNYTIGEYYIGAGADGRVNAFSCEYKRTVGQLVQQYGTKKVSQKVRGLYERGNMDIWIDCQYIIMPNPDRDPSKIDNLNMPFKAATWEVGSESDSFLDVSGFNEFPILVSRWGLTGQNAYGNASSGWLSLGDSKMLQKMQRDKLIQIEKVGDPPTQSDGTVNGSVNTLPGGNTRSSALVPNAGVRAAYEIRPDLQGLQAAILEAQRAIKEAHFENLFLAISQDERSGRTAREIVERNSERLTMLGPLVERQYHEKLSPLIRRQFNIMWRAGRIAPPPPELQGMSINIELISILAQAQKAVGTRAIDETLAVVGEIANYDPQILDVIDRDEAVRARSMMIGLSPKIINSPDKVAQLRQARQQAQQQAARQQNVERLAETAKTVSETKLGTGSALDALVGGEQ